VGEWHLLRARLTLVPSRKLRADFYDDGGNFASGTPLPKGMCALHNILFVYPMSTEVSPLWQRNVDYDFACKYKQPSSSAMRGFGGGFSGCVDAIF
jgi:hypothetical protein